MAQHQKPHHYHHHPCQPYPSQGGVWDRAPGVHRLGQGVAWAAGVAMAAIGGHTWAAVIVVNSLADNVTAGNSLCTLREAARNANNNSDTTGGDCLAGVAGADTIDLSGLTGTITLGGTQLSFTDAVTVQGPATGTLTIDGNHASRIFYIDGGGAGIDLTISRLTLTHARGGDGGAIHVGAVGGLTINQCVITGNTSTNQGGAIFFSTNAGGLTISNSTISNNTASGSGGALFLYNVKATSSISGSTISGNTSTTNRGGGIFLYTLRAPLTISDSTISGNTATGGAGRGGGMVLQQSITLGTLTVERSTISGNAANLGGGFFFYKTNSTLRLENTTVSGNMATAGKGGGIYLKGPFGGSQLTDIRSSTLAFNTASTSGGNLDGGVSANTINITNSIMAGGTAPTGPDINTGSATINMHYSLLQDTAAATVIGSNNITGVDPQLGALVNNGGTTLTRLIANASPARDAGSTTFVTVAATDQRGSTRTVGSTVDMGAVEIQPVDPALAASKIPTLSQWVLALLATLMAWVGVRRYPKA